MFYSPFKFRGGSILDANVKSIIKELINSLQPKVEILEDHVELLEENEMMYDADFSIVRSLLKYDSTKEYFKITYPVYDEELKSAKVRLKGNASKGRKDLLAKGWFVKIGSEVKKLPYGIVEVEHFGAHIARKMNDFRHRDERKIYSQTNYFIFDEEQEMYVPLTTDDVNKSLYLLKTKRVDEIENDFDEGIIDYLKRLKRFKEQMRLIQFEFECTRDKLYALVELIAAKHTSNLEDALKMVSAIHNFTMNEYESLIDCYFLSQKVTDFERDFHLKEIEKIQDEIQSIGAFCKRYSIELREFKDPNATAKLYKMVGKVANRFAYKTENSANEKDKYFKELLSEGQLQRTIVQIDLDGIYTNEPDTDWKRKNNEQFILKGQKDKDNTN